MRNEWVCVWPHRVERFERCKSAGITTLRALARTPIAERPQAEIDAGRAAPASTSIRRPRMIALGCDLCPATISMLSVALITQNAE